MATWPCHLLRRRAASSSFSRAKTTSAQYVAARFIDPTLEKLMETYKHYLKVVAVQDLVLASPSHSLPLPLLVSAAQRFRLRRGAPAFLRAFPHIFALDYSSPSEPLVRISPAAAQISRLESSATSASADSAAGRLSRLLSMSLSKSLPLRAVFRIWREFGLPDDFEDSVIVQNPHLFAVRDNPKERNTHLLQLIRPNPNPSFTPAVEQWRIKEGSGSNEEDIRYAFKQGFPPGMRLTKTFRSRLKEWQLLPYAGPYDPAPAGGGGGAGGKRETWAKEKRAVGLAHEFLSLTVERMVEVEKISHFRKWMGIDLNIRDLFLDHPGMFYLSTKGKRHTVFLREAYEKGRLVEPNPIYDARMKLFELVLQRKRGRAVAVEQRRAGVGEGNGVSDSSDDE